MKNHTRTQKPQGNGPNEARDASGSDHHLFAPDPIRILTAVPICDGHDSAINTINLELIRAGVEVVYLGYHRSVRDIVRAAIQEDVRGVGISSYNGGHVEFFGDVVRQLKAEGAGQIKVFGGGGGTISRRDAQAMRRRGVDRIFTAGTPLSEIVNYVRSRFSNRRGSTLRSPKRPAAASQKPNDRWIAQMLSVATNQDCCGGTGSATAAPVIGITGPGGAGKTTLIDELVWRYLRLRDDFRVAILSHDPSIVAGGALLGDRATMIDCQHDRVFMRSLATQGQSGGLAPQTSRALELLKRLPFDVIILETVGTGQEAVPFPPGTVDCSIFAISPDYGSPLQLQKIAMLDVADVVVVNKSDLPGAPRASAELEQRIAANHRGQQVIATTAKRHNDEGVQRLFEMLCRL
ncbi:cobalamin-dependent protein [Fontivita pretiosa]|uniref:cobalamin-dependent protein n=1 Tax=Fontivita pretiosa TaxID=2989684 RepID=UPI003D175668